MIKEFSLHITKPLDLDNFSKHEPKPGIFIKSYDQSNIENISKDLLDDSPLDNAFLSFQFSKKKCAIKHVLLFDKNSHYKSLNQIAGRMFHTRIGSKVVCFNT